MTQPRVEFDGRLSDLLGNLESRVDRVTVNRPVPVPVGSDDCTECTESCLTCGTCISCDTCTCSCIFDCGDTGAGGTGGLVRPGGGGPTINPGWA